MVYDNYSASHVFELNAGLDRGTITRVTVIVTTMVTM